MGAGQPKELHPQLRAEADAMGGDHLTFHPGMDSLLSDLKAECRNPQQRRCWRSFTTPSRRRRENSRRRAGADQPPLAR